MIDSLYRVFERDSKVTDDELREAISTWRDNEVLQYVAIAVSSQITSVPNYIGHQFSPQAGRGGEVAFVVLTDETAEKLTDSTKERFCRLGKEVVGYGIKFDRVIGADVANHRIKVLAANT